MSLEEFKIIDASYIPIGKLIAFISKGYEIYLNHHLTDLNINVNQLHFLFEISHQREINQEKIASRCNINKGSVARSIRKLEEKGLVERKIDDSNRRQNILSLTSDGEAVLEKSMKIIDKWEDEAYKDIKIEKDVLKNALKQLTINTYDLNNNEDKNE